MTLTEAFSLGFCCGAFIGAIAMAGMWWFHYSMMRDLGKLLTRKEGGSRSPGADQEHNDDTHTDESADPERSGRQ
jgi:uncharacterized iron-regulated membrane protein